MEKAIKTTNFNFPKLSEKYEGKVRDVYHLDNIQAIEIVKGRYDIIYNKCDVKLHYIVDKVMTGANLYFAILFYKSRFSQGYNYFLSDNLKVNFFVV